MYKYEVYVSKYKVTVNRKGEVVTTEFIATDWYPEDETRNPSVPGVFYVAAGDVKDKRIIVDNNRGQRQGPSCRIVTT